MSFLIMDEPLFSIAKLIQWTWPEMFGEDKIVVTMGQLPTEINVMKLLGDLLNGSGWTCVIVQLVIFTTS